VLRRDYDEQVCSIARALEVVGERWSLLILRDVLFGVHRFDGLLASLGITRSVLTERLNHLVAEGVLERRRYQTRPDRFEYHATAKARELWPVLGHLMLWGDRHYAEPEGPPRVVEHVGCGGAPDEQLICKRCGVPLAGQDVAVKPGPALVARGLRHEHARA
jgi:DNA-binding HxlR family transcriptional regulator